MIHMGVPRQFWHCHAWFGLDRWTLKCHGQLPTWTWTCFAINNNFSIRNLLLCFLTWLAAMKCLCLAMWQRIVYRSIKWAKSSSLSSLIHSVGTGVSKQRKACPLVACCTTSKTNSISEIHKCLLQKPWLSVHFKEYALIVHEVYPSCS